MKLIVDKTAELDSNKNFLKMNKILKMQSLSEHIGWNEIMTKTKAMAKLGNQWLLLLSYHILKTSRVSCMKQYHLKLYTIFSHEKKPVIFIFLVVNLVNIFDHTLSQQTYPLLPVAWWFHSKSLFLLLKFLMKNLLWNKNF